MDRGRAVTANRVAEESIAGSPSSGDGADNRHARLVDALVLTGTNDRAAFREVYRLTSAKLFGICLLICGERQGAEDVLQDVYLKIWRNAEAWEPGRGAAITWLAAIARNQAIDWRRGQSSRRIAPLDDAPDLPDPTPCAETRLLFGETSELLSRCLDTLDPPARDAIKAAFFQGLTYAELAARHGVPLGTLKSWIRRGLVRMREQLAAVEQATSPISTGNPTSPE